MQENKQITNIADNTELEDRRLADNLALKPAFETTDSGPINNPPKD